MSRSLPAILLAALALSAGLGGCASSGGTSRDASVVSGNDLVEERAQRALARLVPCFSNTHLSVTVIKERMVTAYSTPKGSIYVTRGLVHLLSDEELTAAIAHEIGHMLRDGLLETRAALVGNPRENDVERSADLFGRQLLSASDIPPAALTRALEKVAEASRGTAYYHGLCERVEYLRGLDSTR